MSKITFISACVSIRKKFLLLLLFFSKREGFPWSLLLQRCLCIKLNWLACLPNRPFANTPYVWQRSGPIKPMTGLCQIEPISGKGLSGIFAKWQNKTHARPLPKRTYLWQRPVWHLHYCAGCAPPGSRVVAVETTMTTMTEKRWTSRCFECPCLANPEWWATPSIII